MDMQAVPVKEVLAVATGNHLAIAIMSGTARVLQTAILPLPTAVLISVADAIHPIMAVIITEAIQEAGKVTAAIMVHLPTRDMLQEAMVVIGITKPKTAAETRVQVGTLEVAARAIHGEAMIWAAETAEGILTETREIATVECREGIHQEEITGIIRKVEEEITTGSVYQPTVLQNVCIRGRLARPLINF